MSKNVVTTNSGKVVIGVKMVGDGCAISEYCHVVTDYRPDLLGAVFDAENKQFLNADDNSVIYHYA